MTIPDMPMGAGRARIWQGTRGGRKGGNLHLDISQEEINSQVRTCRIRGPLGNHRTANKAKARRGKARGIISATKEWPKRNWRWDVVNRERRRELKKVGESLQHGLCHLGVTVFFPMIEVISGVMGKGESGKVKSIEANILNSSRENGVGGRVTSVKEDNGSGNMKKGEEGLKGCLGGGETGS